MALAHTAKRAAALPAVAALAVAALASGAAAADEKKADQPAGRVAAGKLVTPTGTLFRREAPGKPWQVVKEGETLYSGDLLLGFSGGVVESQNGAVRLAFVSDPSGTSPLPIIETAVVLRAGKWDLEFLLERGRVEFASRKDKGQARVGVRIREDGDGAEVDLEPGAVASLEVFGRWPAGVPFKKDPKPGEGPSLNLIFLVVKGELTVKLGGRSLAMKAPPGPALIEWNSVAGGDPSPRKLDELPPWARGDDKPEEIEKKKKMVAEFRQVMFTKSLDAAVTAFLTSDDPYKRRAAVYFLGATDNLAALGKAVAAAKHPDVLDAAVVALRHWIGRGPGQDMKLYQGLIKEAGYRPIDAEAVLQLLHSFGEVELSRPETYETLIDYLGHDRLPIRTLAHWHLVRLVPEGKKLGYDPLAAKEARDKAVDQWHKQWRKLLPEGKLPARPEPEKP